MEGDSLNLHLDWMAHSMRKNGGMESETLEFFGTGMSRLLLLRNACLPVGCETGDSFGSIWISFLKNWNSGRRRLAI